jgi:hypothetical protein
MKDVVIISVHSMVDIITNSSTELFILKDETKARVDTILHKIFTEHNHTFKSCCRPLTPLNYKNKKDIVHTIYSYGLPAEAKHLKFDGTEFILSGASDNSIPSEIMQDIEQYFNCIRMHLG